MASNKKKATVKVSTLLDAAQQQLDMEQKQKVVTFVKTRLNEIQQMEKSLKLAKKSLDDLLDQDIDDVV